MKVFLCGQGPAAEAILRSHLTPSSGVESVAVFTHEGAAIIEQAHNLGAWCTCDSVNNVYAYPLWPFEPDLIVSIYYRTIIRQHVIDRVGGKIFNAHVALLPRNRGRSPIPWAIINDDKLTGVTYHYINAGIDTGRIILQAACQIADNETQTSLFDKVNALTVAYFPAALTLVLAGFQGAEQQGEASYHFAGCPYQGQIDPGWTMAKIERFIRAMTYPPLTPAKLGDFEVRSMDDYRKALYERHRENQSYNRLPVS